MDKITYPKEFIRKVSISFLSLQDFGRCSAKDVANVRVYLRTGDPRLGEELKKILYEAQSGITPEVIVTTECNTARHTELINSAARVINFGSLVKEWERLKQQALENQKS